MKAQQNESIIDIFDQLCKEKILCTKGNLAQFVCYNKQCKNKAFVCSEKSCQCRALHKICLKQDLSDLITIILNKSQSLMPIYKKIEDMFEKAIDQFSEMRDKTLVDIKQKYSLQGITKNQLKLINSIKNENLDEINCQFVWQTRISSQKQVIQSFQILNYYLLLEILFQVVNLYQKQQRLKTLEQIQIDIKNVWNQFNVQVEKFEKSILNYFQNNNQISGFKGSKIIKSTEEETKLLAFFNKKIKSVQMLYRASENQFFVSKFHQKCDNIEHTLTLCQTSFNKVIGGYTQNKWNQVVNNYTTSPQKTSFLFSLTNNQKINVTTNAQNAQNGYIQHQTYSNPNYGPTFGGGHDFYISDKSNQDVSSANIGHTYSHQNYPPSNKESWKRFGGGQSSNFITKQWQVWRIIFE